jgi:hypothetical protein
MNIKPEFVHQIMLKQLLNKLAAAPNMNVTSIRSFELFDIGYGFNENTVLPIRLFQGIG